MLNTPIPTDLCPVHRDLFRQWRQNDYSPWSPSEWPGGSPLMDSRTSHEEREKEWDRKNLEQMELIAQTCRSGRSPQCGLRAPALVIKTPSNAPTHRPVHYDPAVEPEFSMDFEPFDRELSGEDGMGCHCCLCSALKYAVGRHEDPLPYSAALYEALLSGEHVYVSWDAWVEQLRANRGRRLAETRPAPAAVVRGSSGQPTTGSTLPEVGEAA